MHGGLLVSQAPYDGEMCCIYLLSGSEKMSDEKVTIKSFFPFSKKRRE